jgi:hypothetical protein
MTVFLAYLFIAWTGIGLVLLVDPGALANYAGVMANSDTGTSELRAMYGGMELAIGLSALWAIVRPKWREHALFLQAVVTGGIAAGRLVGMVVSGNASMYTLSALSFELSAVLLCVIFARRLRQEKVSFG